MSAQHCEKGMGIRRYFALGISVYFKYTGNIRAVYPEYTEVRELRICNTRYTGWYTEIIFIPYINR